MPHRVPSDVIAAPPSEPGNTEASVKRSAAVRPRLELELVEYTMLLTIPVLNVLRNTAGEINPKGEERMCNG